MRKDKKNRYKLLFLLLLLGLSWVSGYTAMAQGCAGPVTPNRSIDLQVPLPGIGKTVESFPKYVEGIYNLFIASVGILAVVMMMVGGMQWLLANGSSQRIEGAKATIGAALMGLVLALGSYQILNILNPATLSLKLDVCSITANNWSVGDLVSGGYCFHVDKANVLGEQSKYTESWPKGIPTVNVKPTRTPDESQPYYECGTAYHVQNEKTGTRCLGYDCVQLIGGGDGTGTQSRCVRKETGDSVEHSCENGLVLSGLVQADYPATVKTESFDFKNKVPSGPGKDENKNLECGEVFYDDTSNTVLGIFGSDKENYAIGVYCDENAGPCIIHMKPGIVGKDGSGSVPLYIPRDSGNVTYENGYEGEVIGFLKDSCCAKKCLDFQKSK